MFIISGIGSRETPENILTEMTIVGSFCRENKIMVRSGHADGADFAFEFGAQQACVAYLPWQGFNRQKTSQASKILVDNSFWGPLMECAQRFHPAWNNLREPVRRLMARNVAIILSERLNLPSNVVVCWTPNAQLVGGTAHALKVAMSNNIPIINMARPEYETADAVISKILTIKRKTEVDDDPFLS
jgi:hypothetical protein